MRSRWAAIGAAVAVTLGGGGLIGVSAASGDASSFESVTPVRILNTRTGEKLSTETIALQVTGAIDTFTSAGTVSDTVVPTGANAVAVNVTVTGAETKGYVTAFPCAAVTDTPPNASTLNFNPGVDLANSTVVEIGATGKVCFYVKGTAHLLADVQGYYTMIDAYTKDESDFEFVGTTSLGQTFSGAAMVVENSGCRAEISGDLPTVYCAYNQSSVLGFTQPTTADDFTVLVPLTERGGSNATWSPYYVTFCYSSASSANFDPPTLATIELIGTFHDVVVDDATTKTYELTPTLAANALPLTPTEGTNGCAGYSPDDLFSDATLTDYVGDPDVASWTVRMVFESNGTRAGSLTIPHIDVIYVNPAQL